MLDTLCLFLKSLDLEIALEDVSRIVGSLDLPAFRARNWRHQLLSN